MTAAERLNTTLAGGDRRSLGRAAEALALVRANPVRLSELVELLWDSDAVIRMRAADCLEKLSLDPAFSVAPYKAELLRLMAETQQPELRWHLALMASRLGLTAPEAQLAAQILESYLEDRSSIVKTCAMQGLWELSEHDSAMRNRVIDLLRQLTRTGTAAMRARGRKLLRLSNSS